jgi:hypothetical protein
MYDFYETWTIWHITSKKKKKIKQTFHILMAPSIEEGSCIFRHQLRYSGC